MNLEYLIVGIAKGSEEDFAALYEALRVRVYAVALATVKDKSLAREIAVEIFRRIKTYAPTFDTELNAEYWIIDMVRQLSLNALKESAIRQGISANSIADNASALILKTLSELKNERGLLLTMEAVTKLSGKDIAALSGFYRSSAIREARRGLLELRNTYPKVSKKMVKQQLKEDFTVSCPDYLPYIQSQRSTKVAHVSHEALYLAEEEILFRGDEESETIQARRDSLKQKQNRRIKIGILAAACILFFVSGAVVINKLVRDAKSQSKPDRVQTAASMEMLEINNILYYRDANTGIYAYDPLSKESGPALIYNEPVRDLIAIGESLVFRNYKSGKIYAMDLQGKNVRMLTDLSGTSLVSYTDTDGESVYFSGEDGIYRILLSKEAGTQTEDAEPVYTEEVEDAPARFHMAFTQDGTLIFSSGADGGIYQVIDEDLHALYLDEAYYFQIENDVLFFDAIGLRDVRYLYAINLNEKEQEDSEEKALPTIQLYSAAYYVIEDTVYYEGFNEEGKENGLYSLNLTTGTRTLIEGISDGDLHITDMYASSEKLYCYYSDGTSDGESTLIARPFDNLDKTETIF